MLHSVFHYLGRILNVKNAYTGRLAVTYCTSAGDNCHQSHCDLSVGIYECESTG